MTKSDEAPVANPSRLSVDQTVAVLVHELRQPVAAIIGALEMQKRGLSPERRQRAGEVIEHQVDHLSRLLDNLSHVSWSADLLVRERVDACDVIRDAVDMTAIAFQRRGHTVNVRLAPEPIWVDADRPRLTQVFANLLQNAAAYTPEGGTISVSLAGDGAVARVRIKDDGLGIPEEWLEAIFDLFRRGPQSVGLPGTGIGLSVVKRIVALHEGSVTAHSEGTGRGSEFVVTLPAVQVSVASESASRHIPSGRAAREQRYSMSGGPLSALPEGH